MYSNEFSPDFIHLYTNVVIRYIFKKCYGKRGPYDRSVWGPQKAECSPVFMPTLFCSLQGKRECLVRGGWTLETKAGAGTMGAES